MAPERLSATARGAMFLFGIVMALLGAVLPVISARLQIGMAQAGDLFFAMNLSMLLASVSVGTLTDRYGLKFALAGGPLLVLAALAGLAFAAGMRDLVLSMAALGFGGGALNVGANTLVADLEDEPMRKNAALNRLGIYFGFGALLLPLQMAALLESLGLAGILAIACALCAASALYTSLQCFPQPKHREHTPAGELARLAATPLVLAFGLLLFFQSGNEFTVAGYLSTFLVRETGATVSSASYALSVYWASIMLARVCLGRLLLKVDGHTAILVCAGAAAAGAWWTSSASSLWNGIPAIVLLGMGLAGVFPTALGLAGSEFKQRSGTVFGILFTMALAGGMTIPWLAGRLSEAKTTRAAFQIAAIGFAAIFALEWLRRRLAAPASQAPAPNS